MSQGMYELHTRGASSNFNGDLALPPFQFNRAWNYIPQKWWTVAGLQRHHFDGLVQDCNNSIALMEFYIWYNWSYACEICGY